MRARNVWYFWDAEGGSARMHRASQPITDSHADLPSLLEVVETHIQSGGWAALAITYPACRAFDPAFHTRTTDPKWQAVAFLFDSPPEEYDILEAPPFPTHVPTFEAQISQAQYREAFNAIHGALGRGETYQVNLTFPLQTNQSLTPAQFSLLAGESPPPYAAYFNSSDGPILSLSPELFFERQGDSIRSRPMKGTRPRHADPDELRNNPKDRAENLMIVDMIRNDLGRIAKPGTVRVPKLFEVEDHGTVWQMTSTVEAETDAPLSEVFKALFPCASIVGAPKVETTRIIAETESWDRGLYTGTIGIAGPDFAQFNVAIRTIETEGRFANYGIGSGVVWDSTPEAEWQECLDKAAILRPYGDDLRLIETLRWEPEVGYLFLDEHLARLSRSGGQRLDEVLRLLQAQRWQSPQRVRLTVGKAIEIEATSIEEPFAAEPSMAPVITAHLAPIRVDSHNPWLQHKTSLRRIYEQPKQGADELILLNEKGNPTELTIGNLVAQIGDTFKTPPVSEGLLPGVYRDVLLREGRLDEHALTLDDLKHADAIFRINSVRGWNRIILLTFPS